jgi:hypothetical protein
MIDWRVFDFLQSLGRRPEDLDRLRSLPKADVLAFATECGFALSEVDFDETLWQAEIAIAARIGEPFDFGCSMWETMWGKHYLDYLVQNVAAVVHPDMLGFSTEIAAESVANKEA